MDFNFKEIQCGSIDNPSKPNYLRLPPGAGRKGFRLDFESTMSTDCRLRKLRDGTSLSSSVVATAKHWMENTCRPCRKFDSSHLTSRWGLLWRWGGCAGGPLGSACKEIVVAHGHGLRFLALRGGRRLGLLRLVHLLVLLLHDVQLGYLKGWHVLGLAQLLAAFDLQFEYLSGILLIFLLNRNPFFCLTSIRSSSWAVWAKKLGNSATLTWSFRSGISILLSSTSWTLKIISQMRSLRYFRTPIDLSAASVSSLRSCSLAEMLFLICSMTSWLLYRK